MPEFELELDRIATGGSALGVGPEGKVAFVPGGLPGERVLVRPTKDHSRRVEAELLDVLVASDGRQAPPCRHVESGCGGCDWQHARPDRQRELRRAIVVDCLTRLGRIANPEVRSGPVLSADRYRTTVRAAVVDGKAGFRATGSHRIVGVDSCLIADPLVEEVLVGGDFGSASEVTVRAGARTGERLIVLHPTAAGVSVPADVVVVGTDELKRGSKAHYHEEIAGFVLKISADSFFQCRPDGAEVLVDLVGEALRPPTDGWSAREPGLLLDAYCGVGLFGSLLTGPETGTGGVLGVESGRASIADAKRNYRNDRAASGPFLSRTLRRKMERWEPEPVDAVIADPPRSGLGRAVVDRLAATDAAVLALVSCDPASLARDASLLAEAGYELDHVTVVDLFGMTSHVETVSRFVRTHECR